MGLQFPKLILLPGMDGTGELFAEFIRALPVETEAEVLRYPVDRFLSYEQLMRLTQSVFPRSEPFVLIAESFSTPLAIQCAAAGPPNLKGVIVCAGFIASPVSSWRRFVCSFLSQISFSLAPPEFAVRYLLTGPNAPKALVGSVLAAIASVKPNVMSSRLRAVLTCDARAELSKVAVPILYIQAGQDRLVNKLCLEEIRGIKSQTTVITIEGPHLLLQREPQRTADVVTEFIQQLM